MTLIQSHNITIHSILININNTAQHFSVNKRARKSALLISASSSPNKKEAQKFPSWDKSKTRELSTFLQVNQPTHFPSSNKNVFQYKNNQCTCKIIHALHLIEVVEINHEIVVDLRLLIITIIIIIIIIVVSM